MQISLYPFTHIELPILLLSEEYKCSNKIYPIIASSHYLKNDNLYYLDNRCSTLNSKKIHKSKGTQDVEGIYISSNYFLDENMHKEQNYLKEICSKYNTIYINSNNNKYLKYDSIINKKAKKYSTKTEFILNHIQKIQNKFEYYEPEIPIIMVGSLIEFCNQSEMTAKISLELNKRGYKSISIVNNPDFELIGSYHYPKAFFSTKLNNTAKIQLFNNFVKWLVKVEKCKILVIEIPGDLLKFSNSYANSFGVDAFMVTQALMSDVFVLCSPYLSDNVQYYNEIVEYLRNKFDFNTKFIHMSNTILNVNVMEFESKKDYFFMNEEFKDNKIKQLKRDDTNIEYNIDNLLLGKNFLKMVDGLIELLSSK